VAAIESDARRLHLAVAACGSVSMESLVASGLWHPAALWTLIEEARQKGIIVADVGGGGAHLRWADARSYRGVIAEATPEDFAALLSSAPFPDLLLTSARAAARKRDFQRAGALYRAIAAAPDRGLFTGGEATWVAATIEAIRALRSAWPVTAAAIDAALGSAEARGDLAAQAVLAAARGLQCISADVARARALFARATEAAEATGDPALRTEVRTYVAVSLVLAGRPREGIAAFEELLGDVPVDIFDPRSVQLDLAGATPGAAIGILAYAHVIMGDYPRAIDLLDRMTSHGARIGNAALEAMGRLSLALAHVAVGDASAARTHAEAAHDYWGRGAEVSYRWNAAFALAFVRAAEGRLPEARGLLEAALPTWHLVQRPWIGGSRMLSLLESLEAAGLAPVPGLEIEGEIARHLEAPQPFLAGIAHRFRARRLLAASAENAGAAADHFHRSMVLLREAGARPELQLAVADAAELAESRGRSEDAGRLRSELVEVAIRGPTSPAMAGDALRLASAILELGRLGTLPRRDGLWGEVVARLCRELGAERCAIVEWADGGPALLAVRGAAVWHEALLARLHRDAPSAPTFEPALPQQGGSATSGQLVLVPFADEELGRRGFVAFENRETPSSVPRDDPTLLRMLGRQIGILFANVALWRELLEGRQRLEQENRYYREAAPEAPLGGGRIVGCSRAMREVLALVGRVAPTTTPVLVTGETGVGKELVSREVHLLSPRRDAPLIAVHVAALAPGLVASALFGHERGAFTGATEQAKGRFELAHGGTIFLDEIGELSLEDQVRLLRVLQEGTFERVGGTRVIRSDFRLVAATNRDLAAEVRAGRFREDLYFRLAAFPVRVPPLRDRREEIPTLALYFLERASRKLGVRFEGIAEADVARLVAHSWPGNVRELEHVIERAVLLSDPPRLRLPALDGGGARPAAAAAAATETVDEWPSLEEVERRYIAKVLGHAHGRVTGAGGAAEILGLKPSTLQFRIDKLGLRDELRRSREAGAEQIARGEKL
jgi:transcriptional regulator with GAF, ATPase, and Fis domain